jgi:outer membrane protein assembly factor BamB
MQTGAVGEGVVYVTSNDGFLSDSNVFALDVNDGSILWQRVLPPASVPLP